MGQIVAAILAAAMSVPLWRCPQPHLIPPDEAPSKVPAANVQLTFRPGSIAAFSVVTNPPAFRSPYVEDGLICWWDGLWNAGYKQRDAAATTWKNLGTLGAAYDLRRVDEYDSASSRGTWTDDGAVISRDGLNDRFRTVSDGLQSEHLKGEWSYEVVFTPSNGWFSNYSGILGNHAGGLGIVGGQHEGSQVRFSLYSPNVSLWDPTHSSAFSAGLRYSVSQAASASGGGTGVTWKNGELVASVSGRDVMLTLPGGFYVGSAFPGDGYGGRNFAGQIHCVRVYNRPLSDAEVQANLAVDEDRFKLNVLPYDAEVEYLESTGTQWIDTGLILNRTHKATLIFAMANTQNAYATIFGARTGWCNRAFCLFRDTVSGGMFSASVGNMGYAGGYNALNTNWHTSTLDNTGWRFDSNDYNWYQSPSDFTTPTTAKLFGFNWTGGSGVQNPAAMRCSSLKIWQGGNLILDLIPVRIGNEGAMYDKVSKRLFSNQGTGSFVCGRDINPISARSYIKDGLIAMWDGIENDGFGVHNPSATAWKDLIGDCDAATSTALVFADYMYENNTTAERKLTVASKIDFSAMNYLTLESCFSNMSDSQAYHMVIGANTDYFSIGWPAKGGTYLSWKLGNGQRPTVTAGRSGTIAAVYDNGQASLWYNGTMGDKYSSAKNWSSSMYLAWGNCWGLARGTKRCHCYRLYSRALTADEIAINSAIDKARFNLP